MIARLVLALALIFAQMPEGGITVSPSGGGANTYTLSTDYSSAGCTSPCATTVTATTGHLIIVLFGTNANSGLYITGVSGDCGTWVIPSAADAGDPNNGSTNIAYCLSSTGGTSVTVTTAANGWVRILDFSSTSAPALDVCGAVADGTSGTSQPGVGLTLTGTSDVIAQAMISTAHVNAVSVPYTTVDTTANPQWGSTYALNTSSGAAPSFTRVSGTAAATACSFK